MLPFFTAWAEGKNIGIASEDKLVVESNVCPTACADSSPFERWVIDDEYVELRLAIMRGETVEYRYGASRIWSEMITDLTPSRSFPQEVDMYRIKPSVDTSWVTDGAYCRYDNRVFRLKVRGNNVSIPQLQRYEYTKEKFAELYKKWEPEFGDIVYLWNGDNFPIISRYHEFWCESHYCTHSREEYKSVRPYIGNKFWETKGDNNE